jgi:hypothetical protein
MIGMIVWLILMSFVPWVLPQWSAFARHPSLLQVGRAENVEVATPASANDVAAGLATRPGQILHKKEVVPAPPLFFDSIVRSDPLDPNSALEGRGRFNVESYLLSRLGLPVERCSAADLYTCRWLFDGLFPAFMLFVLSYLPLGRVGVTRERWLAAQAAQKQRDDRFFVKMKTKVDSDWEADRRALAARYAEPASLDHLKLFPKSSWEFTKWTWDESLGFGVCWVVAFAILGLLWAAVTVGA